MQEHVQVEASKCKACHRCEIACIAAHHDLDFKTAMKQKALYAPRGWAIKGDTFKTSVRCHGCNPAPCCAICPTGALHQNADGSFVIHPEICAGCMMCKSVCPYGCVGIENVGQSNADTQTPVRHIAVRCDFCADWRKEKGVEYTACMEACMTRALTYVKADGTIIEAPKVEKKAPPKVEAKEAKPAEAPKEQPVEEAKPAEAPKEQPVEEARPVEAPKEQAVEEAKPVEVAAQPEAKEAPQAESPKEDRGGKASKKAHKGKKK